MLKRLWDTENKEMVRAISSSNPQKKCQVWTNDDGSKLYVYDGEYKELSLASVTVSEYWPVWKELEDEEVGYYLTNVATNLYNWDEWDEVAYRFMNWTTVLQSWKIDEGETPEYTWETPTKSATAQYTYTFSGWKPTVWPIVKKTDFKAQFDKTVNKYTVTISVNDDTYGYTEPATINNVPYGVEISENEDHTLSIGTTTVTPHAQTGYVFSSWGTLPSTVTWATSITATFEAETPAEE